MQTIVYEISSGLRKAFPHIYKPTMSDAFKIVGMLQSFKKNIKKFPKRIFVLIN